MKIEPLQVDDSYNNGNGSVDQIWSQSQPIVQQPIGTPAEPMKVGDAAPIEGEGVKRRWIRKPLNKRMKRLKQNRRLRKLLIPKNALMSLHELMGTQISEYKIIPEERGFVAQVLVNNIQYEGRGELWIFLFPWNFHFKLLIIINNNFCCPWKKLILLPVVCVTGSSKIAAKNNASEKALRDLVIQKMVQVPKSQLNSLGADKEEGNGDDVDMKEEEPKDENAPEVPMLHLASFALHKLFSEWQSEGFDIPDFKITHGSLGEAGNGEADGVAAAIGSAVAAAAASAAGVPAAPTVRTQVPENANQLHPTTLLCMVSC